MLKNALKRTLVALGLILVMSTASMALDMNRPHHFAWNALAVRYCKDVLELNAQSTFILMVTLNLCYEKYLSDQDAGDYIVSFAGVIWGLSW